MKSFKKIKDIPDVKSIKYFRSSDLERTKKYYGSDIPFEILYIEGDFEGNYHLVKTPKNPFFIRYYMNGGSFCADKIHMRVVNPYEMPFKDKDETKFFEKNIYINGIDAMYDGYIYYEFFKLVNNDKSLGEQFYLDYPDIHFAEYLFELGEKQRQELKDTINTVHNYSLVIASKKYDYSFQNMKAFFLNEDGGGHMNLKINDVVRYMDGGTTIITLTAFCDGGTSWNLISGGICNYVVKTPKKPGMLYLVEIEKTDESYSVFFKKTLDQPKKSE